MSKVTSVYLNKNLTSDEVTMQVYRENESGARLATSEEVKGLEAEITKIFNTAEKVKDDKDKAIESLEANNELLLDKFVKGKEEKDLLENIKIFPKPADGKKVKKGRIYNYAGELFRAEEDFIYDNQLNPHLEAKKWYKLGQPKKSEYELLLEKAVPWSRDLSYEAGSYVTWYRELYTNAKKITDNEEPGTGSQWVKISKDGE